MTTKFKTYTKKEIANILKKKNYIKDKRKVYNLWCNFNGLPKKMGYSFDCYCEECTKNGSFGYDVRIDLQGYINVDDKQIHINKF
jgi:hypothetical protein|tara:strand:- start:239 stop:493 length:255 start_codon:yes stop_codon:yes gene_type:complete